MMIVLQMLFRRFLLILIALCIVFIDEGCSKPTSSYIDKRFVTKAERKLGLDFQSFHGHVDESKPLVLDFDRKTIDNVGIGDPIAELSMFCSKGFVLVQGMKTIERKGNVFNVNIYWNNDHISIVNIAFSLNEVAASSELNLLMKKRGKLLPLCNRTTEQDIIRELGEPLSRYDIKSTERLLFYEDTNREVIFSMCAKTHDTQGKSYVLSGIFMDSFPLLWIDYGYTGRVVR